MGAVLAALLTIAYFWCPRGGLSSVVSSNGAAGVAVPFTELATGLHAKVDWRANFLITSAPEMSELWKIIDAAGQTPVINFDTNDVIAVFAGDKPTGGYSIAVSRVTDGTLRTVTVTLTSPGGSCFLAESLTSPYQIIEIPKGSLPLTHQDEVVTQSCLD